MLTAVLDKLCLKFQHVCKKSIYQNIDEYKNEKIWGKYQRDCTQITRKSEGIYKSQCIHKALNKVGILLPVNSSKLLQIKNKLNVIPIIPNKWSKEKSKKKKAVTDQP